MDEPVVVRLLTLVLLDLLEPLGQLVLAVVLLLHQRHEHLGERLPLLLHDVVFELDLEVLLGHFYHGQGGQFGLDGLHLIAKLLVSGVLFHEERGERVSLVLFVLEQASDQLFLVFALGDEDV